MYQPGFSNFSGTDRSVTNVKFKRNLSAIHACESVGMQHHTHSHRTLSGIACVTALVAVLQVESTRADVIEITADGSQVFRRGEGAVVWAGNDVATVQPDDGPGYPAAALTPLEGIQSPLAFRPPLAFRDSVEKAAVATGISPTLLEALVWQESRWHPQAVSPAGAIGLGQLMPGTARQLGVNPRDPEANVLGAARYLRTLLDRFDGNLELALAAYNSGPERVAKLGRIPRIPETQAYVLAVTGRLTSTIAGEVQ